MALLAIGNGLLFTYVPIKLAADGYEPWIAGAIITSMAAGSFVGCLVTGHLVRRVGHARVFASLAATINLSVLIIALGTDPVLWVVSRGLYGFAAAGLFVVSQSWLNDACENEWRGRVIAVFYMTYVIGIGVGSYLLVFISIDGQQAPLVSIFFGTAAILPISLTRLQTPPPPASVSVAIRSVWEDIPGWLGRIAGCGRTDDACAGFCTDLRRHGKLRQGRHSSAGILHAVRHARHPASPWHYLRSHGPALCPYCCKPHRRCQRRCSRRKSAVSVCCG